MEISYQDRASAQNFLDNYSTRKTKVQLQGIVASAETPDKVTLVLVLHVLEHGS